MPAATRAREPPWPSFWAHVLSPFRTVSSRFSGNERSVEMHVPPFAVAALPDAGLLDGLAKRGTVGRDALIEPHVGDDGRLAHEADARRAHGRVLLALDPAQVEIETMKGQAFNQLTPGFRLERRQGRVTQLFIRGPIGRR